MDVSGKRVLVIGLGSSGEAAARLLQSQGSHVLVIDDSAGDQQKERAARLEGLGVELLLGRKLPAGESFDFGVISPGVSFNNDAAIQLRAAGVQIIGEFELGYRFSRCLNVSVTGTNGKTTTTELIAEMLSGAQRKTLAAGNIGLPICDVVGQTKDLDVLTLEVSSFQLESIEFFRPAIAVVTNLAPDHLDRYATWRDYVNAKAHIFRNQQSFDWAVIQHEALAQFRELGVEPPSKLITYSARDSAADLFLDRSLIVSRLDGWTGPLLDTMDCRLSGLHNTENLMAALAVGRILRLTLAEMLHSLKAFESKAHRCEVVAEISGVKFINDSKATNVHALISALESMPMLLDRGQNIFLIAGGRDKGLDYSEACEWISRRVKHAFLIGETRERLRADWSGVTACTFADSMLEATQQARRLAVSGDVILLSPACASFDAFENYKKRGEAFREAVQMLTVEA